MIDLIFIKKSPAVCRGFFVRGNTTAGVYAASAATRPPNLFRRSAATFCRIVFHDLAAARRYTLGGRVAAQAA